MKEDNLSELEAIWDEARIKVESGHPDKAIEIYKYILIRYASDPIASEYANAYLGNLYLDLKKYDLAETHIKNALKYQPKKAKYHYLLGFVFSYQRQWVEAIAEFSKAVEREPQNAEFLRGLGWATIQNGDRGQGLILLHQAEKLAPGSFNILTDLAVAYMVEDIEKARRYAEQAISANSDSPLAINILHAINAADEAANRLYTRVRKNRESPSHFSDKAVEVYQFKVSLKDNPAIWRIIEIKGNQLLSSLHKGIQTAFGYQETRTYSFFFTRKKGDAQPEFASVVPGITGTSRLAKSIRIDTIPIYHDDGEKFRYLFDYENMLWHEVIMLHVDIKVTRAVYPRVVKKQGKYKGPLC
jgi:tetratricopeptide (TPR) repeat protein